MPANPNSISFSRSNTSKRLGIQAVLAPFFSIYSQICSSVSSAVGIARGILVTLKSWLYCFNTPVAHVFGFAFGQSGQGVVNFFPIELLLLRQYLLYAQQILAFLYWSLS